MISFNFNLNINKLKYQTFYGHFVAGEDQEKIKPLISRMQSFGVKSILDYSVEEDLANEKEEQVTPRKKVCFRS